jgi:hypothetical protein
MKAWEIGNNIVQIQKLRDRLLDHINLPENIAKPVGMRTILFDRRIKRLQLLEKDTANMVRDGGKRWIDVNYRA